VAGRVGLTFKCRGTLRRVGDGAPANRENTFRIEWVGFDEKGFGTEERSLNYEIPEKT